MSLTGRKRGGLGRSVRGNGALVEMGQNAFGWSSHKETSAKQYVYVLHFNPTDLTSAYGVEEHYYAFPLRCLARQ